jgi:hypothetical protein
MKLPSSEIEILFRTRNVLEKKKNRNANVKDRTDKASKDATEKLSRRLLDDKQP